MDFRLSNFVELLRYLKYYSYEFYMVKDWVDSPPESGIMLRHDVDRKPRNALKLAVLEAEMGIRATYYFRVVGGAFSPEVISAISNLGHEIGYHYEDLSLENGDLRKAYARFERNLNMLRELAPITTIAMHGRPLSPYDGREMWKKNEFIPFGLKGEAFLTPDYNGVYYFTDTGRRWDAGRTNLRDRPLAATFPNESVRGTQSLKDWIRIHRPARIAISAHPERWDQSLSSWILQFAQDRAINAIKLGLTMARPS